MVGPGTGVAAFRSFIHFSRRESPERPLVLIFGCRSESKDFYYKEEWAHLGIKVITAFSRDNEDGSKSYV